MIIKNTYETVVNALHYDVHYFINTTFMRFLVFIPGKGLAEGSLLEGLLEESEETDPGQSRGG